MSAACLLGNGVSIAYNPELRVEALTTDLLRLFAEAGATEADGALVAFASSLSATDGNQFEALLGPLSTTAEALGYLPGIAALAAAAAPPKVVTALGTVTDFLRDVHRAGMAITLGHIAGRAKGGSYDDVILRMANELIGLGPAHNLTVATLNYDGLLHAGLMDAGTDDWGRTVFAISDLAAGYTEQEHVVVPGHKIVGHPVRLIDDLVPNSAQLLQLHGSLGWLRDPAKPADVWRFALDDLRAASYWSAWRGGATDWTPVVVLTDRKERATAGWPFALAYEIFLRRLIGADKWLIVGYGLGDVPVNLLYQSAMRERNRLGLGEPRTLLVGYEEDPAQLSGRAREALKLPASALAVTNRGVPDAFDTTEWAEWKAA